MPDGSQSEMNVPIKQHLIDPEICIRCHSCEEACPVDAITHDDNNVVVDAATCNFCMDCIGPCPTGSIDNWRVVLKPYTLDEQFSWTELPKQEDIETGTGNGTVEALEDDVERLLAEAHQGAGGRARAPDSAAKPTVNMYSRRDPAIATVQGSYRLTAADSDSEVRHIVLDLGRTVFPVLEGQSVGVLAPGAAANGQPHAPRLYSVSSPRDGERPNTNNLSLTVKREPGGVCSNYLCDLQKGDQVRLSGPFGSTFLMPDDPATDIVMVCTGTGSAPFRAFTMRRQRTAGDRGGRLTLFFGARSPDSLPYFGPLQKIPDSVMTKHLVFSRLAGRPKEYVQDRMLAEADSLAAALADDRTHVYVCGLKAMEDGVERAFETIAGGAGLDWPSLKARMRDAGRYHVETY
ncbi:ferredoxin--NADP reductase [Thalassobaculum fulvum]|uniref:Ferredoxin--NADP reductase n=1 Tax=Thalassobaculum fulvum TaxID=1633335 RepID=A0A918XS66_9PROT|nr:benzoyl-CoA 2,3-epoxidase subunit BoxA [Thalassobaculum fulvum]GHD51322.1 ferredoxin--NADP reductase [Thalassobaculum fulvum]